MPEIAIWPKITGTISLYMHWPFCVSKCPYCDFNSHVSKGSIDHDRWLAALLRSLSLFDLSQCTIETIYFGGGTPSTMQPHIVEGILHALSKSLAPGVEITLEVNPTSADLARLQDFKKAGVNRISIGVQALRERHLRFLGRAHDRQAAIEAIGYASNLFDRFSFDLMYGLPDQDPEEWRADVHEALSMAQGGHLSLYELTIEPGTQFFERYRHREFVLPNEDTCCALRDAVREETAKHGLLPYEISNYCVPGQESRHNLRYWRYQDYLGIGPGAHSRLLQENKWSGFCKYDPELWLKLTEQEPASCFRWEGLTDKDLVNELLLMGLRLSEGLSKERFKVVTGRTFEEVMGEVKLKTLKDLLDCTANQVKVLDPLLTDYVTRELML